MKIDDTGNVLWSRAVHMYLTDFAELNNKGFLIVGKGPLFLPKISLETKPQIGIIKTDSLGNNGSECIDEITVTSNTTTLLRDTLALSMVNLDLTSYQPEILFGTDTITSRSGCVDVVGSLNENAGRNFTIYPNPVNDVLHVDLAPGQRFKKAFVFDIYGQKVFEGLPRPDYDVSSLPAGIYLFVLTDGNGVSIAKKFIRK